MRQAAGLRIEKVIFPFLSSALRFIAIFRGTVSYTHLEARTPIDRSGPSAFSKYKRYAASYMFWLVQVGADNLVCRSRQARSVSRRDTLSLIHILVYLLVPDLTGEE